jgi:chromosome segregation ATPase
MDVRLIDNTPFFVQMTGKRETFLTPGEIIDAAKREIADCQHRLSGLSEAEQRLQSKIREALLTADPTDKLRSELAELHTEARAFRGDLADAEKAIRDVRAALDRIEIDAINQADASRLAAMTTPFDIILKEFA